MTPTFSIARVLQPVADRLGGRACNYADAAAIRFIARRRTVGTGAVGAIDEFAPMIGDAGFLASPRLDIVAGEPLFVRGWAIDDRRFTPGWGLELTIDGRVVRANVRLGQERPDVVRAFGAAGVLRCGFEAVMPTDGLNVGRHDLNVRVAVGNRGAAFAIVPQAISFFVHAPYAMGAAPPTEPPPTNRLHIEPIAPAAANAVAPIGGWALDERGRPFAGIAARIDGGSWHAGWIRLDDRSGGFAIRLPLTGVEPGPHHVDLTGRRTDGPWVELAKALPLVVSSPPVRLDRQLRRLVDGGEATIVEVDGERRARSTFHRVRTNQAVTLVGTLRRASPADAPATIILLGHDECEQRFSAWSAPAADANMLLFGATIAAGQCASGAYRLFVEAADPTRRYVGRADAHFEFYVDPAETTVSASGIERMIASGNISTSFGQR